MPAQHRQLVPHVRQVAVDNVAGVGQAGNRTQRHLFAATRDQHRRMRRLDRFRFQDRVLDMKILTAECRSVSLPTSSGSAGRLPPSGECVSLAEGIRNRIAGTPPGKPSANPKCQPPPADHINAGRDLREMRRIAIPDRRTQRRKTDAAGHRGQRRKHGPAFNDGLVRRAHARNLDLRSSTEKQDEAMALRPQRLGFHHFEDAGWIGAVEPGRIVNPSWLLSPG